MNNFVFQSPLNIHEQEIDSLINPFITQDTGSGDQEWNRRVEKIRKNLNSNDSVKPTDYEKQWKGVDLDSFSHSPQKKIRPQPWIWKNNKILMNRIGGMKLRLLLFAKLIEMLRPKRVLEVGFGPGINLLLLASYFPDIEFEGIELTINGVENAKNLQVLQALPKELKEFSPIPFRDSRAHQLVKLHQASGGQIPFSDNSFDLVLTSCSVEQMEEIRNAALGEISRVSSNHVAMFECFKDWNQSGLPRQYIEKRNYFQGQISDLSSYGLNVLWMTDEFPQKAWIRTGMVLCRKN